MSTTDTTTKGPRGSVGQETYDAVTRLIAQGMTKTAAFAKVAEDTGRSTATVMTTYYRIARKQAGGGGVRVRRTAKAARTTARTSARTARKAAAGQTDRLVGDAKAALDALHQHVAKLESELAELTEKSREIDRLKKAVSKL